MNAPKTKWPGTPELRDQRRAQLIGTEFVLQWRAKLLAREWMEEVRKRTRRRDAWVWSKRYHDDHDHELERLRAQVAGEAILVACTDATTNQSAGEWFDRAARIDDQAEAWLFENEVLELDGWIQTATGTGDGKPVAEWRK